MCKVVSYLSCISFGETHTLRTLELQLNLGCNSKPSRHWASMTYHSRGCDHHAWIHHRYTHDRGGALGSVGTMQYNDAEPLT